MKRSGIIVNLVKDDYSRILISEINYEEIINNIIEKSAKYMDGLFLNIDYEVSKFLCL